MDRIAATQRIMEVVSSNSNLVMARINGYREFRLAHVGCEKFYRLELFVDVDGGQETDTTVYIRAEGEKAAHAILKPEQIQKLQRMHGIRLGTRMACRALIDVLWSDDPEMHESECVKLLNKDSQGDCEELSHNSRNTTSDLKDKTMPSVSKQRDFKRNRIIDHYPGEWEYEPRSKIWILTLEEFEGPKAYRASIMKTKRLSHVNHLKMDELDEFAGMLSVVSRSANTMLPYTLVSAPTLGETAEKLRPIGDAFMDALKKFRPSETTTT